MIRYNASRVVTFILFYWCHNYHHDCTTTGAAPLKANAVLAVLRSGGGCVNITVSDEDLASGTIDAHNRNRSNANTSRWPHRTPKGGGGGVGWGEGDATVLQLLAQHSTLVAVARANTDRARLTQRELRSLLSYRQAGGAVLAFEHFLLSRSAIGIHNVAG